MSRTLQITRSAFPPGFRFGAATSAYQIEGHAQGGAGPTHWDTFAATPGNVVRGENGDRVCDHLNVFPQDLDLAQGLGADAYRFSISWARVLPQGRGTPNPQGLDFYDRLLDAMLARGLQPFATLYHWELPAALADLGGWRNRDIAGWFADYADLVARKLGDRLHAVAPINEPWCVAWLSHFIGHHAPGLRDIRAAARAMHHVGLAHGTAIAALRAAGLGNLGCITNHEYVLPADDSAEAAAAAKLYDSLFNRWFPGAMRLGQYPQDVLAGLAPHMPDRWQDDMAAIAAPVDWMGLNYYTCKRIAPGASGLWGDFAEIPGPLPETAMGWEICPEGLYHILTRIAADYAGGLPLYVTENGMAADGTDDADRIAYLDAHLAQAARAIADGVDLRGYFIWSLLDNFEWALGYAKRFGLVHVDFQSLARTPKASYHALQDALKR